MLWMRSIYNPAPRPETVGAFFVPRDTSYFDASYLIPVLRISGER